MLSGCLSEKVEGCPDVLCHMWFHWQRLNTLCALGVSKAETEGGGTEVKTVIGGLLVGGQGVQGRGFSGLNDACKMRGDLSAKPPWLSPHPPVPRYRNTSYQFKYIKRKRIIM